LRKHQEQQMHVEYCQVTYKPNDSVQVKKYRDLLNKEYSFCLKIINDAVKKVNKLYNKQMFTGKVIMFCSDFKKQEEVCDKYNG